MTWITAASGVRVSLVAPDPDTLLIEDIAHALSNLCRFTGHTGQFYSVAQHSVLASLHITDAKFALVALMHDASEAYLGDVSRPLKAMIGAGYAEVEEMFQARLARKFRYKYPYPAAVKKIDLDLLETEYCQFMGMEEHPLHLGAHLGFKIEPWVPAQAEKEFLERYDELAGQQEFDFKPALAKALLGRTEAMSKPLYYQCPECGRKHRVGGKKPHGPTSNRRGSTKRQADDRGRSAGVSRGKGRKTVRRGRGKGTR